MRASGGHEPPPAQVSGVLLRVLADIALQYDVTPQTLFGHDAGRVTPCDPIDLRLPLTDYRSLLKRPLTLTAEPALGLHMALRARESAFDLLTPLLAYVRTLRDALREACRFGPLVLDGVYLHLSERAGRARVRLEFPHARDETDRCLGEFMVASLARLLRAFSATTADIKGALFEHHRPAYHHCYTRVFEGAERFSQRVNGLEFSAELLDRPHLHSNPAFHSLIRAQAEKRLERLALTRNVVDRLRIYLNNQPTRCVPDMAVAARDLGTSERSLRRRLTEEGLSYRALTQEIQREQACLMLRDREFTLQHVARSLGFADTTGFHRAFKRWTGVTASQYRRAH